MLRGPLSKDELKPHIHKYDAIICGDDEYDDEILQLSKGRLKVLSKYGVGLDRIDLKAAQKYNVKVASCAGINSTTVAEHVFALLLAHAKNIENSIKTVRSHKWNREIGYDLKDKKMLIVGYGNIGKEVAKRALAFSIDVAAYDPALSKTENTRLFTNLNEAYIWADIISLHCPLNQKTKGLINKSLISSKKSQVLINTARGGLVNDDDILFGILNGYISGYLADVIAEEPISPECKLPNYDKIIITPHIASRTTDNILKQASMALSNLYKELGIEP
jgi:D-3-phosphoglycerate dehydrogenase